MKKIYTLLVLVFAIATSNAQIVNIPDANFKAKLLAADINNYIAASNQTFNSDGTPYASIGFVKIDTNNDGEIQVQEAAAIKFLDVSNTSISDLTGIQSFTNLKSLYCKTNSLATLDFPVSLVYLNCNNNILPTLNLSNYPNLIFVDCSNNNLNSLNVSQNVNLLYLNCSYNELINIDISQNLNLDNFNCSFNEISSLDIAQNINLNQINCRSNNLLALDVTQNINLTSLNCRSNQLTNLNVTQNTDLTGLSVDGNMLTNLDISQNINLGGFSCSFNQITSLNLNQNINLTALYCIENLLTNLDVTQNVNLYILYCSQNSITELDVSQNINLMYLYCQHNQIDYLDVSQNNLLQELYCLDNQLSYLNLKCNNSYWSTLYFYNNPNLQYICADEEDLSLVQNLIDQYGYTSTCHVNTYCSFVPGGTIYTIQGNTRFDSNNNGCEVNDINIPHQNFTISNGINNDTVFANNSGFYSIPVQAGTHTLTPVFENPSFFNISPTNLTVSFQNQMGPFTQDFCVTANGTHNDLEVTLLPIGPARPGFDAQYKIIYKNKGTTTQSGSINMYYDDNVLQLVSVNPATSSQGADSLNWSFTNLLPFESREITIILNLNSPLETPPVNAGNWLIFSATAVGATDEIPDDNTSVLTQTVVNSFDPNDKTCIQGTLLPINFVGEYVHYIIRFENTGTFAAENVVVKDIIDATKFEMATLVPLSGSHSFVTRVTNTNQVEFIFENINLPFDDANNDGYVAFKIKTNPALVDFDTFSNSASIYFDYNAPIVTDTYTTTVFNPLNTNEFDFNNVFSLSPIPTKDILTITAKEAVVMTSISIYNTLGQLVQVNTNPSETIDVSGLSSGSYFIKIISDRGSATGKFIKE